MSGKVVLITGCSSGIGKALALEFHNSGFKVIATARKKEDILDLEEKGCHIEQLDVTNDDDQLRVVENSLKTFGKIDILINNAGYGLMAPTIDLQEEEIHQQFKTNVYAPLSLIRKVVPLMKENESGIIINMGSISGIATTPFAGAYCASKAALHSFSDALRMELQPFGIEVMAVQPGSIKSNFGEASMERASSNFSKNSWYKSLETSILKRANFSQIASTPTSVFANKIVQIVKSGNIPPYLLIGKKSFSLVMLKKLLPTKLYDSILRKKFGLNSIKSH
ncbi:MAG: SDR family oxidoreductase [Melioribacteraceae bacterium]|nr:SDR family oxidoreductase [Melioribacteraceae bacterium]